MAKQCIQMCVTDAIKKIKENLSNKIHDVALDKNKGKVGQFIEISIGLELNSNCLDLKDGEIKAFPLKKNKKEELLVPKETIAITMTDRESLKTDIFDNSKLYKKIKNIIFVPYFRKGTKVLIFDPILIQIKENDEIYNNIKKDYDDIRNNLLKNNQIQSKIGNLIQSRTKGSKNSKTRAYYFKTGYIRKYIIPHIENNDVQINLINEILG